MRHDGRENFFGGSYLIVHAKAMIWFVAKYSFRIEQARGAQFCAGMAMVPADVYTNRDDMNNTCSG